MYLLDPPGIPFAEPPLGQLRLRPPVLKTKLDVTTFDASNFGKGCLQNVRLSRRFMCRSLIKSLKSNSVTTFSEDCLTINVFRPAGLKPDANLPIVSPVLMILFSFDFLIDQSCSFSGRKRSMNTVPYCPSDVRPI